MGPSTRRPLTDRRAVLKAMAAVSGDAFTEARGTLETKLARAKATLAEATQPVLDRSREAAACTDAAVRDNAWTAVGIAMAAGALIGFIASKR